MKGKIVQQSRRFWFLEGTGVIPPSDLFGRSSSYSMRQASTTTRACCKLVTQCSFKLPSRKRPLNDSMQAFSLGLPGSIRNN